MPVDSTLCNFPIRLVSELGVGFGFGGIQRSRAVRPVPVWAELKPNVSHNEFTAQAVVESAGAGAPALRQTSVSHCRYLPRYAITGVVLEVRNGFTSHNR